MRSSSRAHPGGFRRRVAVLASAAAVMLACAGYGAADERWQQLDALVQRYAGVHDFAGVVAAARGDRLVFERAYGTAHVGLSVPNQPAMRFGIASLTKGFTARAVEILAARGKLGLDDSLARFIPDFPAAEKIRLRHLLTHRSGVGSLDTDTLGADPATLEEQLAMLAAIPPAFEPGTDDSYSNGGYVVLARVVEVVSQTDWASFLRDEIFRPLGMENTGVMSSRQPIPNLAVGYEDGIGEPPLARPRPFDWSYKTGSGSLYSTAGDLIRWGRSVGSRARERPDSELLGWWDEEQDGTRVLSASGRLAGYAAGIVVIPSDDLILVSLSNIRTGAARVVENALQSVALGQNVAPPDVGPYVDLPASAFASALGLYRESDSFAVELMASDRRLVARLLIGGGSRELPLTPRSDSELVDRAFFTTYRLERNAESGDVRALELEDDSGNTKRLLPSRE